MPTLSPPATMISPFPPLLDLDLFKPDLVEVLCNLSFSLIVYVSTIIARAAPSHAYAFVVVCRYSRSRERPIEAVSSEFAKHVNHSPKWIPHRESN